MSPSSPRNIAARAGRWSAQHRKKAILGWLAFVIVAVFIGGSVGTKTLGDWNWYMPTWLEWLPKIAVEEEAPPRAVPALRPAGR